MCVQNAWLALHGRVGHLLPSGSCGAQCLGWALGGPGQERGEGRALFCALQCLRALAACAPRACGSFRPLSLSSEGGREGRRTCLCLSPWRIPGPEDPPILTSLSPGWGLCPKCHLGGPPKLSGAVSFGLPLRQSKRQQKKALACQLAAADWPPQRLFVLQLQKRPLACRVGLSLGGSALLESICNTSRERLMPLGGTGGGH